MSTQTIGQIKRSKWMSQASLVPEEPASNEEKPGPKTFYKKVKCDVQTGNPVVGPLGPPLTKQQATVLVNNSFPRTFGDLIAPYKNQLVELIVSESAKLPDNLRRDFKTLERLSENICSYEVIPGNVERMEKQVQDMKEELTDEEIKDYINTTLKGVATFVVTGFDFMDSKDFCFDKNGNPTAVLENIQRRPNCKAYLEQKQETSQFVTEQADPYKGTQQGLGKKRRTRRRKVNKRKMTRKR